MIMGRIAPGWFRSFAFMRWPSFRSGRWRHVRRQAEGDEQPRWIGPILAADNHWGSCQALSANLARQSMGTAEAVGAAIGVVHMDFFDFVPAGSIASAGLLALNPPYGHRLSGTRQSRHLIKEILRKLNADFKGWRVALVIPSGFPVRALPDRLRISSVAHGGFRVLLVTGRI